MSSSINLLDFNTKVVAKKQFRGQKPLRVIAIALLFTVSASSIIFFLLIALSPIPQLRKEKANASQQLLTVHEDLVKLLLLKDRVSTIKTFIDNRSSFQDTLALIQSKLPPDVSVQSISVRKDYLSITLSSSSLVSLDNVITNLTKSDGPASQFRSVKLKSFSKDENVNNFLLNIIFENT